MHGIAASFPFAAASPMSKTHPPPKGGAAAPKHPPAPRLSVMVPSTPSRGKKLDPSRVSGAHAHPQPLTSTCVPLHFRRRSILDFFGIFFFFDAVDMKRLRVCLFGGRRQPWLVLRMLILKRFRGACARRLRGKRRSSSKRFWASARR